MISKIVYVFAICLAGAAAIANDCRPLHLGAALSLTGKYATNGALAKKAYDFMASRINADGGVRIGNQCHRIVLKYYDDESRGDRGAILAERLIAQDKVSFLLGPYSSALTAAIAPVTEHYQVPMVQGLGASRALYNKGWRYMFAVITSSETYLANAVDLAAQQAIEAGRDQAGLTVAIAVERDPYSPDVRAGDMEAIARHKMKVVVDDRFPRDFADMSATLTKVKILKPDLLLISGHSKGAALATRQLAEKQIAVPMVAMTQCESANIVAKFGADAEQILCPAQWASTLQYRGDMFGSSPDFVAAFRKSYPEVPAGEFPLQVGSAAAALLVMVDAIQRAGSLDREAVRRALRATDLQTFFGRVKFSPSGKNIGKTMLLRQVQDGQYKVVSPDWLAEGELIWPRRP